jgi:hypothetical protein
VEDKELSRMIEQLRNYMVDLAMKKGFTDRTVVSLSQQLDYYLNLYQFGDVAECDPKMMIKISA